MSTRKSSSSPALDAALAGIDAGFRSRLIPAYLALKNAVRDGRYDQAGINTGKFCETCLRFLQHITTGTYIPFGKKISNLADECRAVIAAKAPSGVPESLRVIVPRALVFAYTMRNKRGIGHVGGDVDANEIDLATMTRVTDWIVCELIRVYHNLSLEEAQDLVDSLATRVTPDIWEVGGKKRVLRAGLKTKQETLLLLHSEPSNAVLDDDLCSWVEYDKLSTFARDVLRPLHKARLVEYDEQMGTVRLSPTGIQEVETRIRNKQK